MGSPGQSQVPANGLGKVYVRRIDLPRVGVGRPAHAHDLSGVPSEPRGAILRVIGLRGVSIQRVPRLPSIPAGAKTGARLELGQPIALARVRQAAGFTPLLPPGASRAYVGHDVQGGRVSILMGRVLVTEFRGTAQPFIAKVIDPGTTLRVTRVNGAPGVYLSCAPHQVLFGASNGQIRSDHVRLAGNVLIWQQGPLIVRIEGTRTLAQALAIARSLHG